MKLFDLHCDTLSILENKESAVNLEIMRENEITRVFAIFTPDELKVKAAVEYFDKLYSRYLKIKDKVSAILSVENASIAKTGHNAGQLEKIAGAEGDIEV